MSNESALPSPLPSYVDRVREDTQNYIRHLLSEYEQLLVKYAEVEMHNANLANLYVASHQLHGTLDRGAILEALQEIVVNLIGSEEFAICEISGEELTVAASVGVDAASISWNMPRVRHAAETRELSIVPDRAPGEPLVCLPLQVDGRLVGMVVILGLLVHKPALEPLDHELFDLIATHASTALYCCGLQEAARAS